MTIQDNLNKRFEATIPTDVNDPPRFGQPVETTKDSFIIELRKFFDRNQISSSRLEEVPTIRKYDTSFIKGEGSHETAVRLIQKYPDLRENLPLVAVLGVTGRNLPMGIGTQAIGTVVYPAYVTGSTASTFTLVANDTLVYKTTDVHNTAFISTIIFRSSRFVDITQATIQEVIGEINAQSLYAHGAISDSNHLQVGFGGPLTTNAHGDIEIIDGTALTALGLTIGQKTLFSDIIPYKRYHQATALDVAVEIVAEDANIRTELTDLIWSFFTFYLDDKKFTFCGRSSFDKSISNEIYQVIIRPDPSISGEQEIPRPNDEQNKLYVNRIMVPVTTIQYIDRAVFKPGTTDPFYINGTDDAIYNDDIPQKN